MRSNSTAWSTTGRWCACCRALPFPYPRKLTDEWIASTVAQRADGRAHHLVIAGHEDGKELVIGCVGLRLDKTPHVGDLGYWVGRHYWGHGVATEAVSRVARWALGQPTH